MLRDREAKGAGRPTGPPGLASLDFTRQRRCRWRGLRLPGEDRVGVLHVDVGPHVGGQRGRHGVEGQALDLGFGCIVASEIEAPNMLANLV